MIPSLDGGGDGSVAWMRERDTRIVVVPQVKLPAEAEAAVAAADDGDGQPRNSDCWLVHD